MKKYIVILLILLLALQVIGCRAEASNGQTKGQNGDSGIIEITVGTIGDGNFGRIAARFNQENEGRIRVIFVDYRTDDRKDESSTARLNAELATGGGPDIIDFEFFSGREHYLNQHVLLDMSEYFYRDLQLEDFFVLDKLNSNGLYFFPSSFSIISCYGLPNVLEYRDSWSLDEYIRMSAMPQFSSCSIETRQDFLDMLCYRAFIRWMDWESGTCSFDDGEFARFLQFAAGLQDEYTLNAEPAQLIANGSLLYDHAWISGPLDVRKIENAVEAPVSFIGYPTAYESSGSFIYLTRLAGVNAATEHPEEVWEFLKYMISNSDSQRLEKDIPVSKAICKEITDELLDPMAKYAGKEIVILEDGAFTVDGVYMDQIYDPTPDMSQEQIDKFYALIDSANSFYSFDISAYSIINEAAWKYFNREQPLAAAVSDIQSRVSLYMAEQS